MDTKTKRLSRRRNALLKRFYTMTFQTETFDITVRMEAAARLQQLLAEETSTVRVAKSLALYGLTLNEYNTILKGQENACGRSASIAT